MSLNDIENTVLGKLENLYTSSPKGEYTGVYRVTAYRVGKQSTAEANIVQNHEQEER